MQWWTHNMERKVEYRLRWLSAHRTIYKKIDNFMEVVTSTAERTRSKLGVVPTPESENDREAARQL